MSKRASERERAKNLCGIYLCHREGPSSWEGGWWRREGAIGNHVSGFLILLWMGLGPHRPPPRKELPWWEKGSEKEYEGPDDVALLRDPNGANCKAKKKGGIPQGSHLESDEEEDREGGWGLDQRYNRMSALYISLCVMRSLAVFVISSLMNNHNRRSNPVCKLRNRSRRPTQPVTSWVAYVIGYKCYNLSFIGYPIPVNNLITRLMLCKLRSLNSVV